MLQEMVKITTKPIILVVGARPNFMKIAPIYAELKSRGQELILLTHRTAL
jgi:UDP-N-acetylglucosamine 2-epimerase